MYMFVLSRWDKTKTCFKKMKHDRNHKSLGRCNVADLVVFLCCTFSTSFAQSYCFFASTDALPKLH